MKYLLPIILLGGIIYFVLKGKKMLPGSTTAAKVGTPAATTGTATTPDPFWVGWVNKADKNNSATTNTIKQAVTDVPAAWTSVKGLFGGNKSSGTPSPTTGGSGAGQPINTDEVDKAFGIKENLGAADAGAASLADFRNGHAVDTAAEPELEPENSDYNEDPNADDWGD